MELQLLPSAVKTFEGVIDFYKKIDRELGLDSNIADRVYFEVVDAFSRLLVYPQMGRLYVRKKNIKCLVLGFHLGIFYHTDKRYLTIIAVVDLRQDPKIYDSIIGDFSK